MQPRRGAGKRSRDYCRRDRSECDASKQRGALQWRESAQRAFLLRPFVDSSEVRGMTILYFANQLYSRLIPTQFMRGCLSRVHQRNRLPVPIP